MQLQRSVGLRFFSHKRSLLPGSACEAKSGGATGDLSDKRRIARQIRGSREEGEAGRLGARTRWPEKTGSVGRPAAAVVARLIHVHESRQRLLRSSNDYCSSVAAVAGLSWRAFESCNELFGGRTCIPLPCFLPSLESGRRSCCCRCCSSRRSACEREASLLSLYIPLISWLSSAS